MTLKLMALLPNEVKPIINTLGENPVYFRRFMCAWNKNLIKKLMLFKSVCDERAKLILSFDCKILAIGMIYYQP
jgi:hypothetical protein